jgi:hypothetical protein
MDKEKIVIQKLDRYKSLSNDPDFEDSFSEIEREKWKFKARNRKDMFYYNF